MCEAAAGFVSVRAGGAEPQTGRERHLSPGDQTAALVSSIKHKSAHPGNVVVCEDIWSYAMGFSKSKLEKLIDAHHEAF